MALDRFGTGHDPRLVAQQTSPRIFGRPRFAYRIVSNGKAEEVKARGSFRYRQGVGNPRLTGFQFQPSLLEPGIHELLALSHDLLIAMQDHDIICVAND